MSHRIQIGCLSGKFRRVILTCVLLIVGRTTAVQAALISQSPNGSSTVLDRIVAVVNGTPILASEVDEEMRFAVLQSGKVNGSDNTPQQALDRLIDRALLDHQRDLQPGVSDVSQKDVDQAIRTFRTSIPACTGSACQTSAGWTDVLKQHGFTPTEVQDRIRERLQIMNFLDLRFGAAIRISREDVQKYYAGTLKPELIARHASVPQLSAVAPRIQEVLWQQQFTALLNESLRNLHSEGEIRILDPVYGSGPAAMDQTSASSNRTHQSDQDGEEGAQ